MCIAIYKITLLTNSFKLHFMTTNMTTKIFFRIFELFENKNHNVNVLIKL